MKKIHSLGQVFLKSKKVVSKIIGSIDVTNMVVVEIGSGQGVLTEHLAKQAKKLYCVELDKRFCDYLKTKFSSFDNVEIINEDIVKFNFTSLKRKVFVVGNVPYQISSSLMKYLIRNRKYIKSGSFMFQKEFAEKLVAKPGGDFYKYLSCYVNSYCCVEKLFDISAKNFSPQPKVDSSFVKIDFFKEPVFGEDDEFLPFIQKAFSQRRKKITNSMKGFGVDKDLLQSLGINVAARSIDIFLEDYISIKKNIRINQDTSKKLVKTRVK